MFGTVYHYFAKISDARVMIKGMKVATYKNIVIEKLDKEKLAKKLPYNKIYDPYESWTFYKGKWTSKKVK